MRRPTFATIRALGSLEIYKATAASCVANQLASGHVRVGLQDNLYIAKGGLASNNAELVEEAARIVMRPRIEARVAKGAEKATAWQCSRLRELDLGRGRK
ncbi:3-keto-5-aminohexanoate cleavage protein [Bradyrhizobium yuanmingense]|uniref:3-keto-5-aminohexanoate cleavage protein n=1 Tax=Bradyrhizobium TaxID=374 RepID=UPI000FE3A5F1|nr:hypothetical protein EOW77_0035395 [Bradyrhizobium yuanmingense]